MFYELSSYNDLYNDIFEISQRSKQKAKISIFRQLPLITYLTSANFAYWIENIILIHKQYTKDAQLFGNSLHQGFSNVTES